MGARRIGKEFENITKAAQPWLKVKYEKEADVYNWIATVQGPSDTPFSAGFWDIKLALPADYPFRPPEVTFVTPIYHPNVKTASGEMCDQWLKASWSPQMTIEQVLLQVRLFMKDPMMDTPVEADIASLWQNDKAKYTKNAEEHTRKHAKKSA